MNKKGVHLIDTSSNQQLSRSYESGIESYLDDKEDNFWHDDFYPAWKDDRIGGERAAMNARLELQKELSFSNFADFKNKALVQWQEEALQETDQAKKEAVLKRINQLQQSGSYKEFGLLTGNYLPIQRFIHISNASDDKKQVNYNTALIEPLVDGRYDMMQSVAAAVSTQTDLPVPGHRYQQLYQEIEQGLKIYQQKRRDGAYWTQDGRDNFLDGLSFQNNRLPAHKAKGYAQSYEDAFQAIIQSSQWDTIRAFQVKKALKSGDKAGEAVWEKGDINEILSYLRTSGQWNTKINVNSLYQGTDSKNLNEVIIPSLQQLKESEEKYALFARFSNEANTYLRQNPLEIDRIENTVKKNELPVLLNNDLLARENKAFLNTFKSLSDRMVQKDTTGEVIYNTGELVVTGAAAAGVVAATGGGALVGLGIYGGIGIGTTEAFDRIETLSAWRKDSQKWLSDSWASHQFSGLKNSHVVEQAKQIITYQTTLANKAMQRCQNVSEDDYDKALAYAFKNTNSTNAFFIEQVLKARQFAAMPENEKKEFIEKHQREMEELLKHMQESGGTQITDQLTKTRLENESMMIQAAESGQYFYTIQAGLDAQKQLSEDKKIHLKLYHPDEAKLLQNVSFAYQNRVASEMEANNRENLIAAWKQAGSPVISLNQENYASSLESKDSVYDFQMDLASETQHTDQRPAQNAESTQATTEQRNKEQKESAVASDVRSTESETKFDLEDSFYDFQIDFSDNSPRESERSSSKVQPDLKQKLSEASIPHPEEYPISQYMPEKIQNGG